jgi:Cys-rich four helix bundle protein (predicted Tat secretion target)
MERREFIGAVGAAAIAFGATKAISQTAGARDMHPPKFKAIEESTAKCISTGEDCLRHCLGMLAMGDTSMAACTQSITELLAACRALQTLASVNSKFTPDFAKSTAEVCSACETECRKFYDKYAECKACADACKQCAEDCRKLGSFSTM